MREHWLQLIHILEYLNGTQGLGLKFTRQNFRMTCQADASYLTHNDVKSHSGITYSLAEGGPSISCFSLKQKITAQSSTEAELIALHEGARSTVWISSLMKQLGANFPTPIVYQDNEATIRLATIGGPASSATKHIRMKYFTVKDYTDAGSLTIEHKGTKDMVGDILTKPIIGEQFVKLRKKLLNM